MLEKDFKNIVYRFYSSFKNCFSRIFSRDKSDSTLQEIVEKMQEVDINSPEYQRLALPDEFARKVHYLNSFHKSE